MNDTCPYRRDGICNAPGTIPGPCDVDCTYIDHLRAAVAQLERRLAGAIAEHERLCEACQKFLEIHAPDEWGDMATSLLELAGEMGPHERPGIAESSHARFGGQKGA